jgi:predicted phage terminase large subunit-like protein
MGLPFFACQYLTDPSGLIGFKLKKEWLTYYTKIPDDLEIVIGVDPAISEKSSADYFAMAILGYSRTERKIYVLDFVRGHFTFPQQFRHIIEAWRSFKAHRIVVEVNAYQQALVQVLKDAPGIPVTPYKTVKDKYTRIMNISPYFENHNILLKPGMLDFEAEYVQFDKGEHDDLLDALCLGVTDIVDRHWGQRSEYKLQMAIGSVYKSRLSLAMSSREAGTVSTLQNVKPDRKPLIPTGPKELCWTCGRQKGTCKH